jgi:hypothetical protein
MGIIVRVWIDLLSSKDFDVEATAVPDADAKDEQQEDTTPEWAPIEDECWQFSDETIDWFSRNKVWR